MIVPGGSNAAQNHVNFIPPKHARCISIFEFICKDLFENHFQRGCKPCRGDFLAAVVRSTPTPQHAQEAEHVRAAQQAQQGAVCAFFPAQPGGADGIAGLARQYFEPVLSVDAGACADALARIHSSLFQGGPCASNGNRIGLALLQGPLPEGRDASMGGMGKGQVSGTYIKVRQNHVAGKSNRELCVGVVCGSCRPGFETPGNMDN